ncbi:MAG TPA: non-ribosomal peptide synthetase, partial [Acidobacteria bacterium]|nr:non-ribosomal peptide synthetase [Acidobacteriota bacterium]
DHQVKIRGFRVELGEVESVLGSHPGVAWAVAMVREDLPGDRRLVVYWVPELDAPAAEPDLWRHLRDNLPEHMLPGTLVALEDLPRTPQGKVDRRALPVPPAPATGGADAGDARTPVEQSLERLWAQMLGRQRVGVEESFFELGGHSLLATQVMSRVRRLFGVELPLRVLFETPTVAALARAVEGARRAGRSMEAPPLVPVPRHGPLPLSFSQQQLWVLDQMEPGRAHYNIPFAVKLGGLLHPAALAAALGEIARRHETLRTTFAILEGEPVQVIRPPAAVPLSLADLSALPPEPRRSEARRLALAEAKTPFDLGRGPLLRATLLRLAAEEHLVLLTLHHIVSDGWSSGILVRELAALYCALAQGEPAQLPELPVQYADFAVWQRRWLEGEPLDAQLAYWRRQLAALPVLHLPTDRPRPPFQTFRGRRRPVELPAETVRALRELAVQEGTTLFVPLLSGLAALCHQISGQDDIPIGTDVANRTRQEVEGLIGFFVNQLVMRVDLAGDPTFRELLRRTKEMTLAAWTHQDLPFERLVALQPERDPSRSPLFQVKLVLQNNTAEPLKLPGLGLGVLDLDIGSAKYDLLLNLLDGEGGVQGTLEHSADLFEADTVERWLDRFHRILQGAATRPDDRLSAILATAQPAIPIRRSARWNRS